MQNAADLPDDIEALKAMVLASREAIAARDGIIAQRDDVIAKRDDTIADRDSVIERKEDCIQRLEKLVADFKRALFGARSEKTAPEQYDLALEDIETAMAAVHAEDEALDPPGTPAAKPRNRNRGALPGHLPRIEETIEPEERACACGAERHVIGEDVTERLDIVPARFRVIVTRRPKYACRSCEDGIVQAPAPAWLIPGGLPTEALVAHVLVSKYADHCPLYRQAQIYTRQGIDLDRSTLAAWVGQGSL